MENKDLISAQKGADLVVVSDAAKKNIAAFHQEQNAQLQTGTEFEVFSERPQSYS